MSYVNLIPKGVGAARPRARVLSGFDLYPRRSWRRGVAGYGGRGIGVSFPQVEVSVPLPGGPQQMPTAETSLANAAAQDINDYTMFLSASNGPQYASPAAYSANMITFAKSLCQNSWAPYTCVGFDPVTMGQKYANIVFDALRGIILPSTGKSVYDAWVMAPPALIPGFVPPAPQAPFNPASVPGSSLLPPPPAAASSAPSPAAQPVANSPQSVGGGVPLGIVTGGATDNAASPAPNWPLIAGGAALLLGGIYFLGGSR